MRLSISIFMVLFCCASCSHTKGITVKKRFDVDISIYSTTFVDVEHDGYKDPKKRKRGPETSFVKGEIESVIEDLGMEPVFSEEKAKLKVRCLFRHGLGVPVLTIHLNVITKYITWVNIQLIDEATTKVIGEVEYNRPRSKNNPNDLFKQMFEEMLCKKIEET